MARRISNGAAKPTSANEWRKPREEGYVVTLPSGHAARLRPVALDVLIITGKLPDLLTPLAAKSLWLETDSEKIGNEAEQARGYAELVNLIVPAAMLEPRMVTDPQNDDEIGPEDMDFVDKVAVFQLATQPAEVLRRFRDQQARDVATISDSEDDSPTA